MKKIFYTIGIILLFIITNFSVLTIYWFLRPNKSEIHKDFVFEYNIIIKDENHNFLTDAIEWNGSYYFIYMNNKNHAGSSSSKLILLKTNDFKTWINIKNFSGNGFDIRDPKLAVINNRLFIYCLLNDGLIAAPKKTSYFYTDDGINFSEISDIQNADSWLFWKPQSFDNITWYVTAYWHKHGKTALFNSTDGINWNLIKIINEGNGNDESAIIFMNDGRLLCTIRAEIFPDNAIGSYKSGTLIGISSYPFLDWNFTFTHQTRLDGPHLFKIENKIFAIARYQPEMDIFLTQNGGVFSTKRTSIYLLNETSITRITDLPSSSDTSYGSVLVKKNEIYIAYYTSSIKNDNIWLYGMLLPTEIRMIKTTVSNLLDISNSPIRFTHKQPYISYLLCIISSISYYFIIKKLNKNIKSKKNASKK